MAASYIRLARSIWESQAKLERAIKSAAQFDERDHRSHTAMQAFAGLWGLPVIIAGSCPVGTPPAKVVEDLATYAKAKKYQLKSRSCPKHFIRRDR